MNANPPQEHHLDEDGRAKVVIKPILANIKANIKNRIFPVAVVCLAHNLVLPRAEGEQQKIYAHWGGTQSATENKY